MHRPPLASIDQLQRLWRYFAGLGFKTITVSERRTTLLQFCQPEPDLVLIFAGEVALNQFPLKGGGTEF